MNLLHSLNAARTTCHGRDWDKNAFDDSYNGQHNDDNYHGRKNGVSITVMQAITATATATATAMTWMPLMEVGSSAVDGQNPARQYTETL